jgi:SAM-dependent methyltransferase
MSPNYEYVLQRALSLSSAASPRVLDYGCGRGEVVTLGRSRGVEFHGVDMPASPDERPEQFRPLVDGRIDFADPPRALAEISRVLKPGGVFLVLFPDSATWFEGHVGLYFVHRMPPKLAYRYMMICHRLGFGYYHEGRSAGKWADFMLHQLQTEVFYYSPAELRAWWLRALGSMPQSAESDYMRFRLSSRGWLRQLAELPLASGILSFICRKRAGIVWITRKSSTA